MMRPSSFAERLKACYSGAIHDVLRAKGHSKQTLPHHIRPLNLSHKLAGPVFTIEGRRDDTLDAHQSLLKWCELLSKAPAHVVLICQPNDHTLAHMGELSSETLAYKNVLGYIVDGGCRDSAFHRETGLPGILRLLHAVGHCGEMGRNGFRASYYNRRCHHSFWRLRVS